MSSLNESISHFHLKDTPALATVVVTRGEAGSVLVAASGLAA